jgi:hypothetical protein
LAWIGLSAVIGLGLFAFLTSRAVTLEQLGSDQALRRFLEVRSRFAGVEPLLQIDATGTVTRRPPTSTFAPAKRFRVFGYRAAEQTLAQVDVPIWFVRVKGPAAQYVLRGTGLDLERLGVTAADLEQYGSCLLLDQTRSNGDRVLVWTE